MAAFDIRNEWDELKERIDNILEEAAWRNLGDLLTDGLLAPIREAVENTEMSLGIDILADEEEED